MLVRYTLFLGDSRSFEQLTRKKRMPFQILLEEASVWFLRAIFLQPIFLYRLLLYEEISCACVIFVIYPYDTCFITRFRDSEVACSVMVVCYAHNRSVFANSNGILAAFFVVKHPFAIEFPCEKPLFRYSISFLVSDMNIVERIILAVDRKGIISVILVVVQSLENVIVK